MWIYAAFGKIWVSLYIKTYYFTLTGYFKSEQTFIGMNGIYCDLLFQFMIYTVLTPESEEWGK